MPKEAVIPGVTGGLLVYDPNNSGGRWWLNHEDYLALEQEGWIVYWVHSKDQTHEGFVGGDKNDPHTWKDSFGKHDHKTGSAQEVRSTHDGGDWFGATADGAGKRFDTAEQGVREWERITGQTASEEGCNCCGNPHSFEWKGDDGSNKHSSVEVTRTEMSWW